jgi:hypothetical protein
MFWVRIWSGISWNYIYTEFNEKQKFSVCNVEVCILIRRLTEIRTHEFRSQGFIRKVFVLCPRLVEKYVSVYCALLSTHLPVRCVGSAPYTYSWLQPSYGHRSIPFRLQIYYLFNLPRSALRILNYSLPVSFLQSLLESRWENSQQHPQESELVIN